MTIIVWRDKWIPYKNCFKITSGDDSIMYVAVALPGEKYGFGTTSNLAIEMAKSRAIAYYNDHNIAKSWANIDNIKVLFGEPYES